MKTKQVTKKKLNKKEAETKRILEMSDRIMKRNLDVYRKLAKYD